MFCNRTRRMAEQSSPALTSKAGVRTPCRSSPAFCTPPFNTSCTGGCRVASTSSKPVMRERQRAVTRAHVSSWIEPRPLAGRCRRIPSSALYKTDRSGGLKSKCHQDAILSLRHFGAHQTCVCTCLYQCELRLQVILCSACSCLLTMIHVSSSNGTLVDDCWVFFWIIRKISCSGFSTV